MSYLGTKPSNSPLTSELIPDGLIATSDIADNAITTAKIAAGAVVQADLATGVAGTGPAFSAYQSSAQSLTANTITKLQFQTEEFDTANCFDSLTNYRFTPNVAGYYQVSGAYSCNSFRTYQVVHIYKNGSVFKIGQAGNSTTGIGASISALIYLNGTTDYIELYALSGTTQNTYNVQTDTWFQAVLVRTA